MSYVGEAVRYTDAVQASSKSGNFSKSVPAGHWIMVAIAAPSTTAETVFTFTDSVGNTYTQRGVVSFTTPINSQLALFSCHVTTPIVGGSGGGHSTWTATSTTRNPNGWCILGEQFSRLTAFDKVATNFGTASKDMSTGTTGSAAQDRQMLFGAWEWTDVGGTSAFDLPIDVPAWSGVSKVTMALGAPKSLAVGWQFVDESGVRTATAHQEPTNATWTAGIIAMNRDLDPSGVSILKTGPDIEVEMTLL